MQSFRYRSLTTIVVASTVLFGIGSTVEANASAQAKIKHRSVAITKPPAPTGLKATSVTDNTAKLVWTATRGSTKGYNVYIGGDKAGHTTAPSYTARGLKASTVYRFKVMATTSKGSIHSVKSSVLKVKTKTSPVAVPVAPSTPTASGTTETQTTLSWNNIPGATGYDVYRDGVKINNTPDTTTEFIDIPLNPNTTYVYTVKALNTAGSSSFSAARKVKTLQRAPSTPKAPTSPSHTATNVNLSWSAVSGATGYNVYRNGTKITSSPVAATSYNNTSVSSGTSYSYTISAVNSRGSSAQSPALTVTTNPAAPATPTATNVTSSSVSLSWISVNGATSYNVYRNGVKITPTAISLPSMVDSTVSGGTTYSYTIVANGSGGASTASSPLSVTTTTAANQAPPTPTGLKTTSVTSDSVGLAWDATGGNTNGYSVYIAGGFIGWTSTPTYSATGLTPSTSYDFQVVATTSDNSIYSPKSSVLSVTTLAVQNVPSAPSGLSSPSHSTSTVSLSWSASSGATGYNVYRNGTKITSSAVTTTSYSDNTVTAGSSYSYTVDALNSTGPSGQSSALSVSTTPSAPSAPTATVVTSPVSASLTWGSVFGATSYDVYRNGAKITSSAVTTTSYSDTAVTAGTTYSYTVTANGLGGISAQSPSVQFTAAASDPTGLPQGNLPGWTSVFGEDFTRDSTLGSFTTDYTSTMGAYPYPWTDTSHNVRSNPGYYNPEKTLSVSGGKLDAWLHYDSTLGRYLVAAPTPKLPTIKYGLFEMRLRADQIPGYKIAPLLWPDSESWPNDGEIDFPEGDLNGNAPGAFAHYASSSGGQDAFTATGISLAQWHTYETAWSPTSVKFYVDGNLIGTSTKNVPQNPMHWVLQFETTITSTAPPTSAQGHVQVDWIKAYSYTPGTP